MGRIRSVHPALFTDETFVSLSYPARVLWIGLWCEADDQGVFGWKPLSLHLRLAPTATEVMAELLQELAAADCIRRYEVDGKPYGVIRNFAKHQRPKRPRDYHPLPEHLRDYAGFLPDGSRPNATTGRKRFETEEVSEVASPEHVRNTFRTCSGERSQMETETETLYPVPNGTGASAPPVPSAIPAKLDYRADLFRDGLAVLRQITGKNESAARSLIGRWLKSVRDDARLVLRTIEDARAEEAADPVPWIEASLRGPRRPDAGTIAFANMRH